MLDADADLVGLQELVDINDTGEVPRQEGTLRDSLLRKYPYRAGTTACDLKVLSKYPVKLIKEYPTFSHYEVKMPWGKLNWINTHLSSFNLTDEERKVMKEVVSVKDTEPHLHQAHTGTSGCLLSSPDLPDPIREGYCRSEA